MISIQLTESEIGQLSYIAEIKRISVENLVRKAIELFLANHNQCHSKLYQEAFSVIGKYKAGVSDISTEHDRYLDEAFGA